ncbi:hypothetical protein GUITHDRAFT_99522 [Guillardia theta CCMP2712]|uniref:Uncharacterized protein n=1 Tax=Guillardia theta (strain CCMP2712) TaxID=905079 RepID=L1K347_GUITC|nr:hypothetical protein GUITHDRAFT_99522 [Guillardia theta CCMP2712]EKX54870.1 hypothetical protein GUITHDRAFT_99522 [Guillardia theta CCMP2712]|eukprot:XP_005841850.1 hypothetical protein GUITHDRAFT_99522 [Guillardia theta CCMP2712]
MAHARDFSSSPSVDGSTVAGRAAIDSLLMESNVERPFESEESFAQWVQTSYRRWSLDPTISEQLRILDLETVHEDVLSRASQRLVRAQEEYASCPAGSIIDGLRDKVSKLRMECQGRERQNLAASNGDAALLNSAGEKNQKSSERLQAAYAELDGLTRDLESKISSCAEWKELQDAEKALLDLRREVGIEEASMRMKESERAIGRQTSYKGFDFEGQAERVVKELILPRFLADAESWWDQERSAMRTSGADVPVEQFDMKNIFVLRGLTLGIARGEFDYVIVAKSTMPSGELDAPAGKSVGGHPQPTKAQLQGLSEQPVLVLAIVEVKRNVNDMGSNFMGYVERIAWFSGMERGYDPTKFATNFYRSGHFDRPFWHSDACSRKSFKFDRSSFRLFFQDAKRVSARDDLAAYVMERLNFVTRHGTIRGMSSKAEASLKKKVARDKAFARARSDCNKDAFSPGMETLLAASCSWVHGWWEKMEELKAGEMSTEDLLLSYRRSEGAVDNIYLIVNQ